MPEETKFRNDITAYILPEDPSEGIKGPNGVLFYPPLFHKLFDPEYFENLFMRRWPIDVEQVYHFAGDEAIEYIYRAPRKPFKKHNYNHLGSRRFLVMTQRYIEESQEFPKGKHPELDTTVIIIRSTGIKLRDTSEKLIRQRIPCGQFTMPLHSMLHWSDGERPEEPKDLSMLSFNAGEQIRRKLKKFRDPFSLDDIFDMVQCILSDFIPASICDIARKVVLGTI